MQHCFGIVFMSKLLVDGSFTACGGLFSSNSCMAGLTMTRYFYFRNLIRKPNFSNMSSSSSDSSEDEVQKARLASVLTSVNSFRKGENVLHPVT